MAAFVCIFSVLLTYIFVGFINERQNIENNIPRNNHQRYHAKFFHHIGILYYQ